MTKPANSLVEDFQKFFTVDIASTPKQIEQVFRVRYRVYCEEFEYEPLDNFPDGLESDEFDSNSLHCLITHRSSNLPAGCVRLVERVEGGVLPMEAFCLDAIEPERQVFLNDNARQACEISRLAVDCQFRRRSGEHLTRFGHTGALDYSKREQRTFSLIAVAAYLSACAMADLSARHNIYAMMEPFLPKLMKRSGIPFTRIGSDLDYHGTRAPYLTTSQEVVAGLKPELRELYDTIHQKFTLDLPSVESTSGPLAGCDSVAITESSPDRSRSDWMRNNHLLKILQTGSFGCWGQGLPSFQYV